MKKDLVLEEISTYPKEIMYNMLLDQLHNKQYIENVCRKCQCHRIISHTDYGSIHICNDDWSKLGGTGVGEHVFYCETKDICIECGGFNPMK
jgi:ribosomal protein L40E